MNYYERHLGDYAKDTGHLSLLEHGVYTLLLDRYYATESGIPEDQAHRIARARSADERAAVDVVLAEFFRLEGNLWVNGRVEEELEKARGRIATARANGRKGGRPPKKNQNETHEEPNGFPLGSGNETGSKAHQSPDTTFTPDRSKQAPEISEGATLAGRACLLMRQAGCPTTNPSHPDLLAGLAEGVTPEAYADTVTEGLSRAPPVAKPFAWAITTARARHAEGPKKPPQNTGTHHGPRRLAPADEVEQFILARQQGGNVIDAAAAIAERHGSAVETHGSDLRPQVDQRLHGESGGRGGGDVVEGSFRVVGSAAC